MKPLGKHTAAEARDDETIRALIALTTGLSRRAVRRGLEEAHGRSQVSNLFREQWPLTTEALGALTVAFARDVGLHEEIQQVTKATSVLVARRLNQNHGKTLLRNAFADVWPEDGNRQTISRPRAGAEHWPSSEEEPVEVNWQDESEGEFTGGGALVQEDASIDDEEGVESEDTGGGITKPFDPNKIRVKLWTPTVDLVLRRLREGEIDLAPDFQRAAGVWKDKAQSQLIESLLIRIPLPAFYVDGSDENRLIVVDGIQRLTALKRFVLDKTLRLRDLEYLRDIQDLTFDELPRPLRRRIEETMLTVYLIDKGTPEEAKLNIFKRLNTGGLPLKPQEIRHAMNPGPVRDFLRDLAQSQEFVRATQGKFLDDRMTDRECALRFCAFVLTPPESYQAGDLDAFLHRAMKAISAMTEEERDALGERFARAMRAAHAILREQAFRKPRGNRPRRPPVNKALFEAWAVGFDRRSDAELERLEMRADRVQSAFDNLVEENREFEQALSQGTGDTIKVRRRFGEIDGLLREIAQ